ncbi:hypothetical protein Nepgr_030307 [Nepenthes gracilis]|uniref:Uncharacterized protein n=1 Tax=Nepenthes gracilis TaxID=150966 RepID=A0AAD3TFW5_NEPGR|nr:hypothetical protein Nepgr_030307 [Nepenthes gracilis]
MRERAKMNAMRSGVVVLGALAFGYLTLRLGFKPFLEKSQRILDQHQQEQDHIDARTVLESSSDTEGFRISDSRRWRVSARAPRPAAALREAARAVFSSFRGAAGRWLHTSWRPEPPVIADEAMMAPPRALSDRLMGFQVTRVPACTAIRAGGPHDGPPTRPVMEPFGL